MTWDPSAPGVVALPSGRLVRGRSLQVPLPDGPVPDLGLYLLARHPDPVPWSAEWVPWRDFRLPVDPEAATLVLRSAWERSATSRVEVACRGGRGRTGTALACIAVLDGVPAEDAVEFVRHAYDRHAVETPGQRRFVREFAAG